ncbi:MAG: GTPase Era [Oscillospiraceae bacterium]|jgi:GTP-binding protein Era|nr:GTPase Era [Oscillospiraceae bacterium]
MSEQRFGMVSVLGRPNTGKSTLINALCGEKVSIVSPKPQTTRARLCAVVNEGGTQMALLDTPGITNPKNRLGEYMRKTARESARGNDAVVMVAESVPPDGGDRAVARYIAGTRIPAVLALNKTDTVAKEALLPLIEAYSSLCPFLHIVPVSAKKKDGVELLKNLLLPLMPPGPPLFPPDMTTDLPDMVFVAELIREKVLLYMREEVPHGAAVVTEKLTQRPDGLVEAHAVIYCEKVNHKGMFIGKGGAALGRIGKAARLEMERLYEGKVSLRLHVKVRENWRDNPEALAAFGYR